MPCATCQLPHAARQRVTKGGAVLLPRGGPGVALVTCRPGVPRVVWCGVTVMQNDEGIVQYAAVGQVHIAGRSCTRLGIWCLVAHAPPCFVDHGVQGRHGATRSVPLRSDTCALPVDMRKLGQIRLHTTRHSVTKWVLLQLRGPSGHAYAPWVTVVASRASRVYTTRPRSGRGRNLGVRIGLVPILPGIRPGFDSYLGRDSSPRPPVWSARTHREGVPVAGACQWMMNRRASAGG